MDKKKPEEHAVDTQKQATSPRMLSPTTGRRRRVVVDTIDGATACANVAHFMSEIGMMLNI